MATADGEPVRKLCWCGGYAQAFAFQGDAWAMPDGSRIVLILCDQCGKIKCPNCMAAVAHKAGVCKKCLHPILRLSPANLTIPDAV